MTDQIVEKTPFCKPLTERQLNRRRMMQGMLASGAFAAIATMDRPALTYAQATPEAAMYDGPLAADQFMTLPTTEPTTMDPGVSYGDDELDLFWNIFDGLVGVDTRTGEVVPLCAESWDINEDASQFIFHIRQGMTWSDGTPLNANDFVYSWQRVLDPNTLSQYMDAMAPIKNAQAIMKGTMELSTLGVTATDDYTLTVDLEGPTTFFPLLASTWTYFPVPKHVIEAKAEQWVEAGNMVSNGAFVLTEWTHDQKMVIEANASYYGTKPTLTKATYTIFADDTAQAFTAYEAGELDYCEPGGPDLERINADDSFKDQIIRFELSNTYFIVCDTTNAPTDKLEFRQALSKAISRDTLANTILKGEYLPAPSVLPTNIPGNNPDAVIPESVDEAKALLVSAGIDPSTITLDFVFLNLSFQTTVAQYLQAAWQDNLGIKVTMSPIEDSTYSDWRASRETQPFGVYTGSWGSDFADASNWFNQNFTTESDHYRNHWSYPEFDDLVAKAVNNTNVEERNQQYSQAEAILVEQAGIIPMLHGKAFRMAKPWVKDLFFQPILSVVHLRTIKIA
ncbi:MAG TPA: peptide ABC transporter substrate-binding protein, partial [Thermomicrobiales bacterium]|nr:peptide ABC transporter substrate-binding protein [Thermomicrobiales bacterium]